MFRSTPPREGRLYQYRRCGLEYGFDPRPHARGDGSAIFVWRGQRVFRSTPPREGRPAFSAISRSLLLFRSTPPREGRPLSFIYVVVLLEVSIHAPTRGATCGFMDSTILSPFRSTPPREGRPPLQHAWIIPYEFRSTPPREGRLNMASMVDRSFKFRSTPPREGRRFGATAAEAEYLFRSTPPREGRPWLSTPLNVSFSFRSTPPREGRLAAVVLLSVPPPFRSTPPREGRPGYTGRVTLGIEVSIHAPTRGATRRHSCDARTAKRFDPRPHARGDSTALVRCADCQAFRSTPPREGRLCPPASWRGEPRFRSTPPREGRPDRCTGVRGAGVVSIHAPTRGATRTASLSRWPRRRFDPRPHARGDVVSLGLEPPNVVSIHAPTRGATVRTGVRTGTP